MRTRKLATLAIGLSAAATMLVGTGAASASTAAPDSITTYCTGSVAVCLEVDSTGLFVQSATVINGDEPTGYGYIENGGDGAIHRSPYPLSPGQSYTYYFNRVLGSGVELCGWIGSVPGQKACGIIHA